MNETEKHISELMRVFAAITGIIMGAGFMFMGLTDSSFLVVLFGFIAMLTGLVTSSMLVSEEDEKVR